TSEDDGVGRRSAGIGDQARLDALALAGRDQPRERVVFSSRRRHTRSVSAFLLNRSSDLVLIRHHDYDQCFQSVQLLQWNSQVKFNVTVYRNLPTTRDSIMTS